MSATPSPSLPLPPPLPLPMPPSPHRTVRRLTMENLPPLARIPAARSQSPERIASPVAKEMPTSPNVHCSQYRMYTMEQYERQNGPLPWHCKVGSWLRYVHAAYEPDGPSSYPTPPTAPWKDRYVSESESELAVRAGAAGYAYQERRALCAQGLRGLAVLLCYRTSRGRPTRVLQHARHPMGTPSEVSHRANAELVNKMRAVCSFYSSQVLARAWSYLDLSRAAQGPCIDVSKRTAIACTRRAVSVGSFERIPHAVRNTTGSLQVPRMFSTGFL